MKRWSQPAHQARWRAACRLPGLLGTPGGTGGWGERWSHGLWSPSSKSLLLRSRSKSEWESAHGEELGWGNVRPGTQAEATSAPWVCSLSLWTPGGGAVGAPPGQTRSMEQHSGPRPGQMDVEGCSGGSQVL